MGEKNIKGENENKEFSEYNRISLWLCFPSLHLFFPKLVHLQ